MDHAASSYLLDASASSTVTWVVGGLIQTENHVSCVNSTTKRHLFRERSSYDDLLFGPAGTHRTHVHYTLYHVCTTPCVYVTWPMMQWYVWHGVTSPNLRRCGRPGLLAGCAAAEGHLPPGRRRAETRESRGDAQRDSLGASSPLVFGREISWFADPIQNCPPGPLLILGDGKASGSWPNRHPLCRPKPDTD